MPILSILPNLVHFALLPLSARTVPNTPSIRLPTRLNPQPPRLPTRPNPQPRAAAAVLMVDGADDGSADLALLSRRINELKSVCKVQALCLPEVLLPGQRMHLPLMPAQFADLVLAANSTDADGGAEAALGVLGAHMGRVLTHGVRARVTGLRREFSDSGYGEACRWSCTLVGGQVFERTIRVKVRVRVRPQRSGSRHRARGAASPHGACRAQA